MEICFGEWVLFMICIFKVKRGIKIKMMKCLNDGILLVWILNYYKLCEILS